MGYKQQPVAHSMLVLPRRRPGSPTTKVITPASHEQANIWRPESPISQASEIVEGELRGVSNMVATSPGQRPDRSFPALPSPSHRSPPPSRREDLATANRMRLPTPSPPQRSPPKSPTDGREGLVSRLDLQGGGALPGAPLPLEPVDGTNAVWDIVSIIQQAATRKMISTVRNYIRTYDPKDTGCAPPPHPRTAGRVAPALSRTK